MFNINRKNRYIEYLELKVSFLNEENHNLKSEDIRVDTDPYRINRFDQLKKEFELPDYPMDRPNIKPSPQKSVNELEIDESYKYLVNSYQELKNTIKEQGLQIYRLNERFENMNQVNKPTPNQRIFKER